MDISRTKWHRLLAVAVAAGLAVGLAACGTEPARGSAELSPVGPSPTGAPADAGEDESDAAEAGLEVVSPADGATVTLPFDVTVDTAAELGPIDDELHHIHIWFDDGEFALYDSATVRIETAPAGTTTMFVQLHTSDHDPVIDPVATSLTVETSTGGGSGNEGPGYTY